VSDWTVLDSIESDGMDIGTVAVKGDRTMLAFSDDSGMECLVEMGPDARDALRELLDRAAMPGQRVNHGPACGCTPCKAEPSYEARRG
jgi:hypothetical protein